MNNRKCQLLVWMNSHYCSPAKTVTQRLLCLILLFHKTERCTVRVNHTMAAKLSADYSENQSVCRCLQSCVQRFCFHVGSLSGSLICAALWKSTCTILDFLHFFFFVLHTCHIWLELRRWSRTSTSCKGRSLIPGSSSEWVSVNVCASQHAMLYEVLWVLMLLDLFRVKWWI